MNQKRRQLKIISTLGLKWLWQTQKSQLQITPTNLESAVGVLKGTTIQNKINTTQPTTSGICIWKLRLTGGEKDELNGSLVKINPNQTQTRFPIILHCFQCGSIMEIPNLASFWTAAPQFTWSTTVDTSKKFLCATTYWLKLAMREQNSRSRAGVLWYWFGITLRLNFPTCFMFLILPSTW